MDDRTIARWRCSTLRLTDQHYPSTREVVGGLLAVQAENHPQASWAVASRTTKVSAASLAEEFDAGRILRTHVLRPTWHYALPEDLRWLIELTAPRVRRSLVQQQRDHDLDETIFESSRAVIVGALQGGSQLTRPELARRLEAAGLPYRGMALGLLLFDAELAALICSGAMDGKEHTYALLDERAPNARRLERDEALAEIVLRYFTGHGPATERDLAYWATLTLTDVRAGLDAVGDRLASFEHDGRTYWFGQNPPSDEAPPAPRAHLLQTLDEYHNGYQASRYVLDADGIVPRGRPTTVGMVLVDTQMVGGMRRTVTADEVRFDVNLFRDLAADESEALQAAADRYAAFLGVDRAIVSSSDGRP